MQEQRNGTNVIINVPKIIVDKMPWTKPPTNTRLKEKQGQPAAQIDNLIILMRLLTGYQG